MLFLKRKVILLKKEIWKKAGEWYAKEKKHIIAEEFFYKSKEFDLLLSTIEINKGRSIAKEHKKRIIKYLTDCLSDVRERYHLVMLIYMLSLFTFNEIKLF